MKAEHPLDGRALVVGHSLEGVGDVDASYHQYAFVLLDLTDHLCGERPVTCVDTARFQRAPEGTGQSPACSGDQVVDRGGLRWIRVRRHAVMLCDRAVDSERDRPLFARQPRMTDRTAEALDPNFRAVDDITHLHLSLSVVPCLHE